MKKKIDWKYWLNEWESYASAIVFIALCIMLTVQVISRYVFHHAFTVIEEIAINLFVLMIYLGVSSAVTHRKQLTISALPDALPFKAKKVLLIIDDLIFMGFCIWLIFPFTKIIQLLGTSTFALSGIQQRVFYWMVPFGLAMTAIRLVQDVFRLAKEEEHELGVSAPSLDLDSCEQEYRDKIAARAAAEQGKEDNK